jgi:hypothetical protein
MNEKRFASMQAIPGNLPNKNFPEGIGWVCVIQTASLPFDNSLLRSVVTFPRQAEKRERREVDLRAASFDFWQGTGHKKPPTLAEVLGALLDDARGPIQYGGKWKAWAKDLGIEDTWEAKQTWDLIEANLDKLSKLFGEIRINDIFAYWDAHGDLEAEDLATLVQKGEV